MHRYTVGKVAKVFDLATRAGRTLTYHCKWPDVHGVIAGAVRDIRRQHSNMARNSEKRLSGLNRFLEAKETGEHSMGRTNTLSFWCNRYREKCKATETSIGGLLCVWCPLKRCL